MVKLAARAAKARAVGALAVAVGPNPLGVLLALATGLGMRILERWAKVAIRTTRHLEPAVAVATMVAVEVNGVAAAAAAPTLFQTPQRKPWHHDGVPKTTLVPPTNGSLLHSRQACRRSSTATRRARKTSVRGLHSR